MMKQNPINATITIKYFDGNPCLIAVKRFVNISTKSSNNPNIPPNTNASSGSNV